MRQRTAALGSAVFLLVGPGTVAGVVPWLLSRWRWVEVPYFWPARALGVVLLLAGAGLLVHAFVRFVVEGIGTPVPVAAPDRLVVGGAYRWVRNPMYVALLSAVLGQALLLAQWPLAVYGLVVWGAPAAYVRWREEPMLVRRFGEDYERYRRAVPAWLPRIRPWTPPR